MSKIIVHCAEGYSGSSRKNSDTLSAVVEPILKTRKENIVYKEIRSKLFFKYERSRDWIYREKTKTSKLFLIGKSLGGYNTLKLLNKYGFQDFDRVAVLFIDAHGAFFTLGKWNVGVIKGKHFNKSITNYYQQRKYPQGAYIKGATNINLTGKGIDHWNIINRECVTHGIDQGLNWLVS